MRYFYTILFYLALPCFFLRLLWRSRHNAQYRQRWAERLGFCPYRLQNTIWVHAVSVGETLAAVPLIKALLARYPQYPLLVTTMTITGAARVHAALGEQVKHAYIPYDTPGAVVRFLKRIQPSIAIIMETELWPNLFSACQQRGIPIILTNARLSPKSQAGYQRISTLTRQMLLAIRIIAAQSSADAQRFIELGMPKERIAVTGNIKFDMEIPADLLARADTLRVELGQDRLVWIAASTHEGEEAIILAAHKQIRQNFPHALLLLVPRHPERFDTVALLAQQQGYDIVRRSQATPCAMRTAVYIGDTMGELLLLYAASDVAFVGGSLIARGGHNLLEPAMLSKPVLSGPSLFNFSAISDMLAVTNALTKVHDAQTLADAVQGLFQDPALRQQQGTKAYAVVEANRGALAKQLACIYPFF